jgi:plasmid maintenance system antidote protein VapI
VPKNRKSLPLMHPGEILREDLMKPLGLSRRSITADTSLRLARYLALLRNSG